jgi:hypothetical protein
MLSLKNAIISEREGLFSFYESMRIGPGANRLDLTNAIES